MISGLPWAITSSRMPPFANEGEGDSAIRNDLQRVELLTFE
jgi:hypothetical protein